MAATPSKTSSDPKRGNFEEDDVQMLLKLVKELLKQHESTLQVFLSAHMNSVNTIIDNEFRVHTSSSRGANNL